MTETQKQKTERIAGWLLIRLMAGGLLYCGLHYAFWYIHTGNHTVIGDEFAERLAEHTHLYIGRSLIKNGCVPKIFLEGDL